MVDPPTLKRRKSLSSGLSSLALTPIHPQTLPPPTPTELLPTERPYSFLAVVLEGFANEPLQSWEERGEPCPRLEELIGEDGKAQASCHRRPSLAAIEEQHSSALWRRGSHTRRKLHYEKRRVASDLDPLNEVVELAKFDADDSELNVVTSLYYRYTGKSASERNLSRILSRGPRPNLSSPPPLSPSSSPLIAQSHLCPPLEASEPSSRPIRSSSSTSCSSVPNNSTAYVSIPLVLPCLVPLPASPPHRPLSIDSSHTSSSEPPSLSSSLCSLTSSALSSLPPTPMTLNFPLPALRIDNTEHLKTVEEQGNLE
ncbi:hypothetical protein JCM3765_007333 [Sporobolomyces pararoseus]